jgi:purine operon repressor
MPRAPERMEAPASGSARVGGRRAERLALLAHLLATSPGRLLALGRLADTLGVAKSTLSEDLGAVARALKAAGQGQVVSLTGAAGGVVYRPSPGEERVRRLAEALCRDLNGPERRIAGGFVFTTDLIFSPSVAREVGEVFAGRFWRREPEAVATLETKGIPLALMTAHALGVPLVTVRRDATVTEGPALGIHYVSGSSRVQTMTLPRRALAAGTRVLLVDDFLKAGGTARGLMDLMDEFGAEVVGLAVLIETAEPAHKLVSGHFALLRMTTGPDGAPAVEPSPRLSDRKVGAPERAGVVPDGGAARA